MTPLSPKQLTEISERTVGHYNSNALSFWEGTRDHDVSQNVEALLKPLLVDRKPPLDILDLGYRSQLRVE